MPEIYTTELVGSLEPHGHPLREDPLFHTVENPRVRFLNKKDGSKVLQYAVQTFGVNGFCGHEWVDVPVVEE